MINPMHKELFDFYLLHSANETSKRAIRKTINKYFNMHYPSKKWNELTDTEKREFKLITMKNYMLDKILYPDKDKKTKPTARSINKANLIEEKITAELKSLHKPLIYIEKHNKEMEILKKEFYDSSASKEENYKAYLELCEYHSKLFPALTPPPFEKWQNNPQRLFDIRESYKSDIDYSDNSDDEFFEPVSNEEIMNEVIQCILKELNISIDIESIKHCIEVTRNLEVLDYEIMGKSPREMDIATSLIKLKEHDFIKRDGTD